MKKKSIALTISILLLGAGLAGCAQSKDSAGNRSLSYASDNGGMYKTAGTASSFSYDAEEAAYYEDDIASDNDESIGEDGYAGSAASMDMPEESGESSQAAEGSEPVDREKLVYTGGLSVETTSFASTLTRIRQSITDMGGFIESENDSDDSYGWYMEGYRKSSSTLSSYIHARIPSSRFYEFLDGIEGEGAKVTNRYVNVENISRRYSETATSIESYQIQERRLLAMMEEAKRVSDMLEIESRLSEVQGYLKQYQNALSGMDTDVAYSTVSINVREVGFYSQPEATSFGEKITEAFSDGIVRFRNGAADFCIWLAGNFLDILVFILVIWVVVVVVRKIAGRMKKGKRAKRQGRERKKKDAQAPASGTEADPAESSEADEGKDETREKEIREEETSEEETSERETSERETNKKETSGKENNGKENNGKETI